MWAFVLLDYIPEPSLATLKDNPQPQPDIQHLLDNYSDVVSDPQSLPPPKSYDHAIPLLPGSVPINSKPYHYSPHHKNEIEKQVQQLLQAGLIAHSHSPFASPVLLVKKRWLMEVQCRL